VVWHPGPQPRYALISSWESSPVIDRWIKSEIKPAVPRQPSRRPTLVKP